MPEFGIKWLEIARRQYDEFSPEVRKMVDLTITQLLEDPETGSSYDKSSDQWTTDFGNGVGLITYAVVHQQLQVIVLRLLHL